MRGVEPFLQTYWDWRAAGNFLCGGAGTGLLLAAVLLAPQGSPWLIILSALGLLLVGIGLLCVLAKIGRPMRALRVFLKPKTSWMSREAILAMPLFLLGLLGLLLSSRALLIAAALLGLVFLYCQGRILTASRGIPAWREPLVLPLTMVSGLAEGVALMLLLTSLTGEPVALAAWLLGILLVARWYLLRSYQQRMTAHGGSPQATVEALAITRRMTDRLGHGLPLAAIVLALLLPTAQPPLLIIAGISAASAGWYFKYSLITQLAYTQGFSLHRAPARTPGMSSAGTQPGWE